MIFMTRDLLVSRVHHSPGQPLVYVNNSKVACSTIKRSMWEAADASSGKRTFQGHPHERGRSPFLKEISDFYKLGFDPLFSSEWFSVVRNPFVRVLSAYLNKIPAERRDPHVWAPLKKRFRMPEETPPFPEFMQMLLSESLPDALDWHFCPQAANLLFGFAPLSFVGQLEAMEEVEAWMAARGIPLKSVRWHATNARELVDRYYGPAEVDAALKIYQSDFDEFGYSRDPGVLEPIRPVALPKPDPEPIRLLLQCFKPTPLDVRREAYNELAKRFGDAEFMVHLRIDAGLAEADELMNAFDGITSGRIRNWRTAMRLGQVFAYREMAVEAAKVLDVACSLMYPQAARSKHREIA